MISNDDIRRSLTNLELGITHVSFQVDDRLKVQQMRIDKLAVTERNLLAIKLTLTNSVLQYRHELEAEIQNLIELLESETDWTSPKIPLDFIV